MLFALAFTLFLFTLTCVVVDGAFLFRWSSRAQAAAQLGAESGADAVNPRFLYASGCTPSGGSACSGAIVDTDPRDRTGSLYAFQRACIETADQSAEVPRDPPGDLTPRRAGDPQAPEGTSCASNGCRVFAKVTRVVQLPLPLPGFPAAIAVAGTAYAAPVVGTTQAQTTCGGSAWVPAPSP